MEMPQTPFIEILDSSVLAEGSLMTVEVAGRKIVLARHEGKIHALDDTCPHLGGSLGKGTLQGNSVACPRHRWCFDLQSGQCVGGPAHEKVAVHEVKTEDGKVLVKPDLS